MNNKEEVSSVLLCANLHVVPHANEFGQKLLRMQSTLKNISRSATHLTPSILRSTTTQNLTFLKKMPSEGSEVDFDQDFILCTVFGYKNMYIKDEDDVFEIFIPIKRNDYKEQGLLTQVLLNGYRSESSYSQYEVSSNESSEGIANFLKKRNQSSLPLKISPRRRLIKKSTLKKLHLGDNDFEKGKNHGTLDVPKDKSSRKLSVDVVDNSPQLSSESYYSDILQE